MCTATLRSLYPVHRTYLNCLQGLVSIRLSHTNNVTSKQNALAKLNIIYELNMHTHTLTLYNLTNQQFEIQSVAVNLCHAKLMFRRII